MILDWFPNLSSCLMEIIDHYDYAVPFFFCAPPITAGVFRK